MKKTAPILMALLAVSPGIAQGAINYSFLSAEERALYIGCKEKGFFGTSCEQLREGVCRHETNRDEITCLTVLFGKCERDSFREPECLPIMENLCKKTNYNYSPECNRLRYENCLQGEFREPGCLDVRMTFTQRFFDKVVEKYRKEAIGRGGGSEADIGRFLCSAAGGDTGNPLFSLCPEAPAEPWRMSVRQLEDIFYFELDYPTHLASFATVEGNYRAVLWEPPASDPWEMAKAPYVRHENTLPQSRERAVSVWDSVNANHIWRSEFEEWGDSPDPRARKIMTYATRLLADFGDDSTVSNYLLVKATQSSTPEVVAAALAGLERRTYKSGLVMLAILKNLRAQDPVVRAAALRAASSRWVEDFNSAYRGRMDARELAYLFDCKGVTPDAGLYERIHSVGDVSSIDLDKPEVICTIGEGARLYALNEELWKSFTTRVASSASLRLERLEAVRGLVRLAQASRARRDEAQTLLWPLLESENDVEIRVAALEAYDELEWLKNDAGGIEDLRDVKKVFALLTREFERQAAARDVRNLDRVLALIERSRMVFHPHQPQGNLAGNALPVVRDGCVAQSALPFVARALCFRTLASTKDHETEALFLPALEQALRSGTFVEKQLALNMATGLVSYSGAARELPGGFGELVIPPDCAARRRGAELAVGLLLETLSGGRNPFVPLAEETLAVVRHLVASVEVPNPDGGTESLCRENELVWRNFLQRLGQPESKARLTSLLGQSIPRLPMDSWYKEFQTTHQDVIEKSTTLGGSSYVLRSAFEAEIENTLRNRSNEAVLWTFFGLPALEELYLRLLSGSASATVDSVRGIKREFWGIEIPRQEGGLFP